MSLKDELQLWQLTRNALPDLAPSILAHASIAVLANMALLCAAMGECEKTIYRCDRAGPVPEHVIILAWRLALLA
ncbi:hypothetical protein B0H13DRAFT_2333151 [Mycena leptocephala]|nr:hypothetical protein B0H13DRAFT_2387018 [Mycena leptocephala]KAJ7906706.1 hypothetical protein B0H13DRAFT_2333151 [Mycena leptocephala]